MLDGWVVNWRGSAANEMSAAEVWGNVRLATRVGRQEPNGRTRRSSSGGVLVRHLIRRAGLCTFRVALIVDHRAAARGLHPKISGAAARAIPDDRFSVG